MPSEAPPAIIEAEACGHCLKLKPLCVCDSAPALAARLKILILQHPQEQDKELGTARIVTRFFPDAILRIGLSWPSLSKALGREVDPARWGVLYLGSASPDDFPQGAEVVALDRKGSPVAEQARTLARLQGLIVLDGTWSQAKALWWRNAWMLKCQRIALNIERPSLYGKLRREPRKGALSTLEAVAALVSRLEKRPDIEAAMLSTFRRMLQRYRDHLKAGAAPATPRP